MRFKASLWCLLCMDLWPALVCLATPAITGWPESVYDEDANTPALEWWKLLESAAVICTVLILLQQLMKLLTSLGVNNTSGPRPAMEQTIHCSLPYPALCIFSTSAIQTLFRHDGPVCFAGLPAEALDCFSQSCVQKTLHHTDKDFAYSLPLSALETFSSSALQHYWRSLGSCLTAITMAALDLFEGSLVQQSVEEERVLMPLPSYIHPQGQDLGPSAAMLSTEADASLNISTEPVVLHSQSSLKRAIFGLTSFISFSRLSDLTASAAPAASPMQTQADTAAPPVTTPPETPLSVNHSSEASLGSQLFSKVSAGSRLLPAHSFIPGLLCSFKPTLTAVQPLEQPMFDTTSHLTNPIIGQEELAGEDGTHSSSVKFGAVDASPTSSSGVRGLLATNTSSLAEAIERESAADKAARQEADEVFLEKTNKPKALLRISSSVVDFTIKAFRLSNNVEVPNNNNEEQQAAASERDRLVQRSRRRWLFALCLLLLVALLGYM